MYKQLNYKSDSKFFNISIENAIRHFQEFFN